MPYVVGSPRRFSCTFTDIDTGLLVDPTTIKVEVEGPTGAVVNTYVYGVDNALVRDALGKYHVDITPTAWGAWKVKWISTGVGAGAQYSGFYVPNDGFPYP